MVRCDARRTAGQLHTRREQAMTIDQTLNLLSLIIAAISLGYLIGRKR